MYSDGISHEYEWTNRMKVNVCVSPASHIASQQMEINIQNAEQHIKMGMTVPKKMRKKQYAVYILKRAATFVQTTHMWWWHDDFIQNLISYLNVFTVVSHHHICTAWNFIHSRQLSVPSKNVEKHVIEKWKSVRVGNEIEISPSRQKTITHIRMLSTRVIATIILPIDVGRELKQKIESVDVSIKGIIRSNVTKMEAFSSPDYSTSLIISGKLIEMITERKIHLTYV